MPPSARDTTTYSGNRADGDSTNIYGNVYGDVHFPGRSNEPAESVFIRCLRDLRVTDPREDLARIKGEKGTLLRECYAWILEDASFQQWRTQDTSQLLWIKGDPGKGKTMMMVGLVDELSLRMPSHVAALKRPKLDNNSACLLSYFFCHSAIPTLNNAVSVLRSLIYMLIRQKTDLLQYVQEEYEIRGKQLFEGSGAVSALSCILKDMLDDHSLPTTYLLVDALDECTSELSELLRIITDASLGRHGKVKWLVTSRSMPEIERCLQPYPLGVKLSLEVKSSHVSKAVEAFVEHKVQRLATVQQYDTRLQTEVQQQLHSKAEGTFLWVSLVCKELEKISLYRTREVLQALPPGLDPLYNSMMAQIEAQDSRTAGHCKSIIQAVALAFRPLEANELAIAAGLPRSHFSSVQEVVQLISGCGSFLAARADVYSFVHLSARDYFTAGNGRQVFNGTLAEEHKQMTGRLLGAMDDTLRRDVCGLQKPGARIDDAFTTECVEKSSLQRVVYACEFWVRHLKGSGQSCSSLVADDCKVHSFLSEHLLHWLEAMSLLQKMPEAILALRQLVEVVKETGGAVVSNVVHDALRFAMWCMSGIEEAPLQVYYGALVFAPEQSIVRQNFAHEAPKGLRAKSGLDKSWGPRLQSLEGHRAQVNTVAISSMGALLASASDDETVRIWDVETGQLLHKLEGHEWTVTSVAFSPTKVLLASASSDTTVRLWNTKTGQPLHTLEGHTECVRSVVFSATGNRLASCSNDKTVRLWDAKSWQPLHTLVGHATSVTSVAMSAAGDLLASGSSDKTVRIWDPNTGEHQRTLEGHTAWVSSVSFAPLGDLLASASGDTTVRVWNPVTGQLLHVLRGHSDACTSVTFTTGGDRLASASRDSTVRVWSAETGHALYTLEDHASPINSIAFSPLGDRLISASEDCEVWVWDVKIPQPSLPLKGHTDRISSVAFSPMGTLLASASEDETVLVWSTMNGQLLYTYMNHASAVYRLAFAPEGDRLVLWSESNEVRVWNVKDGESVKVLQGHTGIVSSVSFSSTGDRLASASKDKTVRVWNLNTEQPLHTLEGHTSLVNSAVFSRAGDRLASASGDKTARLWDAKTGRALHTLKGHADWVNSVAFSADGDRLASASYDKTLRVWDTKTGQVLHTLKGHTDWVNSVAFSAYDGQLASASWDETVRVWDAKTGQLLRTLERVGIVSSIAFSGNGPRLLAGKGTLLLPNLSLSASAALPQARAKTVFVTDRWLTVDAEDVLWIPANYQARCTAVHSCHVAFGYSSGRVLLLDIV